MQSPILSLLLPSTGTQVKVAAGDEHSSAGVGPLVPTAPKHSGSGILCTCHVFLGNATPPAVACVLHSEIPTVFIIITIIRDSFPGLK